LEALTRVELASSEVFCRATRFGVPSIVFSLEHKSQTDDLTAVAAGLVDNNEHESQINPVLNRELVGRGSLSPTPLPPLRPTQCTLSDAEHEGQKGFAHRDVRHRSGVRLLAGDHDGLLEDVQTVLFRSGLFVDIFTENVSKDLVQVLQAIIILFVAAEAMFRGDRKSVV